MRILHGAILAVLLAATNVFAAPPEVPSAPVLAKVGGKPAVVSVKMPKDAEVGIYKAFSPEDCLWFPGETDASGVKVFLVQPYKPGIYRVALWTKNEVVPSEIIIDATGDKPDDDIIPKPKPKPDDPPLPPAPVGFRVLFIVESGDTPKSSLIDAKEVRDYLNAKCSKHNGHPEWRVRDKDVPPTNESPEIKSLWESVQVTYKEKPLPVPCVVIAVNGTFRVEPIPKTAAALLELLKKHGGIS